MGRVFAVFVVVVALGAVLWLILDGEGVEQDESHDVVRAESPHAGAPPVHLEGRADEQVTTPRGAVGGLTVETRRGGAPVEASVEIFFLAGVSRANPTQPDLASVPDRATLMMAVMTGLVEGAPQYVGRTGPGGRLTWSAAPAGAYVMWATGEGGRSGFGWVTVPKKGAHILTSVEIADGEHAFEGRVFLREGEPFVGALSMQYSGRGRMDQGPAGRILTDEKGAFRVLGVRAGSLRLMAVLAGGGVANSPAVVIPVSEPFAWTIESGARSTIRGQVVAAHDGTPVANARVMVACRHSDGAMTTHVGTSDSAGGFAIEAAGPVIYAQARARGYVDAQARVEDPSEPVTLQLARLHSCAGRVVEKGTTKGVGGVYVFGVSLGRGGSEWEVPTATTDPSGRFLLQGLTAGQHMIFALGRGWYSAELPDVKTEGYNPLAVAVAAEQPEDLVLEVVQAAKVEGEVLRADGSPVVGAVVTPRREGGGPRGSNKKEGIAVTGVDGTFTHDTLLPNVLYRFKADAPGLASISSEPWEGEPGEGNARVTIRFASVRGLDLVVLDAKDGTPIAGVEVLSNRSRDRFTTDPAGRVRLEPLPEGEIQVRLEAAEHLVAERWIDVPEEQLAPDGSPFVVSLKRGVTVKGRVTLPEGVESNGLSVSAQRGPRDLGMDSRSAPVAQDGTFAIHGLPSGPCTLFVSAWSEDGYLVGSVDIEAPTEDAVLTVTRSNRPRGPFPSDGAEPGDGAGKLDVTVVGPDARLIPTALITLHHGGGSSGTALRQGRATLDRVKLDADVYLEIREVAAMTPPVGAGLYGPFRVEGRMLRVRMEPAAPTRIRAVDGKGTGVKGALVKVLSVNPRRPQVCDFHFQHRVTAEVHTNDAGEADLGGLKAGDYHLYIAVPPGYIQPPRRQVSIGGDALMLTIRHGGEAEVTVLDYAGGAVRGVQVHAVHTVGAGPLAESLTVARETTDDEGKVVLRGLDPDVAYTLSVSVPAQVRQDVMGACVDAWDGTSTTIRLERAWVTEGLVLDPEGNPAADALVWYRLPGASGASGVHTDAKGRFRIGPQANWVLEIRVVESHDADGPAWPGSPAENRWMRVEAGRKDVELLLDPGAALVLKVEPWSGPRNALAHLCVEGGGPGRPLHSPVAGDGTLRFRGLDRSATYALWIAPDPEGRYVLEQGIRPDAGTITVSPQKGGVVRGRLSLPDDVELLDLRVFLSGRSMVNVTGRVEKDGSFEIVGVPPGRWRIHASGRTHDVPPAYYVGQLDEVEAGSTLELPLKRVER